MSEETHSRTETNGNPPEISIHLRDVTGQGIAIGPGATATSTTIINNADKAYDVSQIYTNPYLGLAAYTYNDQPKYAGREPQIVEAVDKLTTPSEQRVLLFITGASGSGKSSFARAGVLPALEQHYTPGIQVRIIEEVRPSKYPLDRLIDGIQRQSGLPSHLLKIDELPHSLYTFLGEHTGPQQANLLLIDQFEEIFTQSEATQRDNLFAILANLPPFHELRTHILVTVRSDYLPELFQQPTLYDQVKHGIDLRAMSEAELKTAIQRPLLQQPEAREKCFESELLDVLAKDAAQDATYLPLLQVTLERLWKGGSLKRAAYSTLTDAIRQRAEEVFDYQLDSKPRTPAAQNAIIRIFLDLVEVSLDNDARRDVRRRRTLAELTQGQHEQKQLIDELTTARLLSTSREQRDGHDIDVVDIIHESLISNWKRLHNVIAAQREQLQQRVRFEAALNEWLAHRERPDAYQYQLRGKRLFEAIELSQRGDIALMSVHARVFLTESEEGQGKAELLLEEQFKRAESQRLAFEARELPLDEAETALLLACEAISWHQNVLSEQVLRDILEINSWRVQTLNRVSIQQSGKIASTDALYSYDGKYILTTAKDTTYAYLWSSNGDFIAELELGISSLACWRFNHTSDRVLTLSKSGNLRLWDTDGKRLTASAATQGLVNEFWKFDAHFSLDDKYILTLVGDDVRLWDANGNYLPLSLYAPSPDNFNQSFKEFRSEYRYSDIREIEQRASSFGHIDSITEAFFTPDGSSILTTSEDRTLRLWSMTGKLVHTFPANEGGICSPDGSHLLTRTNGGVLWTADGVQIAQFPDLNAGDWLFLEFSPDGTRILIGSSKATGLYASDGKLITKLPSAHRLGFSPDGTRCWIVSPHSRQQTQLFTSEGVPITTLAGEQIIFSKSGLAATADGKNVRVWDAQGHQVALLTGHTANITRLSFSPDDQRLLTAQAPYGEARLWEQLKPWPPMLHRTEKPLSGARYIGNDAYVLTAEVTGGQLTLWSTEGEQIRGLPGEGGGFKPFSAGGGNRLITSQSSTTQLWEMPAGAGDDLLATLLGPHTGNFELQFIAEIPANKAWLSPDGWRILAVTNGSLTLWSDRGKLIATLDGGLATTPFTLDGHIITCRSISDEGRRTMQRNWNNGSEHPMFSMDPEKEYEALLWSRDGVLEALIPFAVSGGRNKVESITVSPDGERILFIEEHSIQLYDIPTGRMRNLALANTYQSAAASQAVRKVDWVAFSPDSKVFLTGSDDPYNKGVKLWSRDGKLIRAVEGSDEVTYQSCASFSSDGTYIAVNLRKDVLVFTTVGEHVCILRGHSQRVNSIVFSLDSKYVLTASNDNTARLWRNDGSVVKIFRGHTAAVKSAVFSSDERRVLTASEDGTARQFMVNVDDLLKAAAQRVGRGLTQEEIERFLVASPLRFKFSAYL